MNKLRLRLRTYFVLPLLFTSFVVVYLAFSPTWIIDRSFAARRCFKKGTGKHRTGPLGEISFPNLSSYSSPDRYSSGPWMATWHGHPYGQIITLVIGYLTYTPLVICVFECLLDLMILSSMYSRPSTWLLLNLTCTNPF